LLYGEFVRNITGNNALGNDFFDRKREIARYWDKLETDNLLLLAPRRVGKTSIMKTMANDASRHGFAAVYVDVSDSDSELRFVQKVWSSLLSDCPDVAARDQLSGWLKNSWAADLVKTFKKAGGYGFSIEIDAGQASWQQVGEEVSGLLGRVDARCLIFIDELPVFVLKLLGDGSNPGSSRH
jgi:AAA+ ATPase superfamily predicted ATPase